MMENVKNQIPISRKIKKIWNLFKDKEFRDVFMEDHVDNSISAQIYSLRVQRNLKQSELSEILGTGQSYISKIENDCSSISLSTLKKLASAFDVALNVKFVPYSESVFEMDTPIDRDVPSYESDSLEQHSFTVAFDTGMRPEMVKIPMIVMTTNPGAKYATF